MLSLFKEADASFYSIVESGESQKLNEDFMIVPKSEGDLNSTNNGEAAEVTVNGGGGNTPTKLEAPVFNVTKVVINHAPTSFNSIDHEDVVQVDEEKPSASQVTVSTNGGIDSAEQEATEI